MLGMQELPMEKDSCFWYKKRKHKALESVISDLETWEALGLLWARGPDQLL